MTKEIKVLSKNEVAVSVDQFTSGLTQYLGELGLPNDNVLVPVQERQKVISNVPDVIELIDGNRKTTSIYLSKFIAACGAGLFDAALNFIWDETVVSLRNKVARFDLEYFYDSVVTDTKRRSKLKDESDLQKIEEWELIRGCHLTGILSDIGYKHLDYIRDMRNWASAAHPNQNDLTGFQLLSWLETCIKEVIAKEPEGIVIEVKRFLNNIRNTALTEQDAQHIRAGIEYLPPELAISVLRTIFGMYTTKDAVVQVKTNIKLVADSAWNVAPEEIKYECGFKYATFASNGEVERKEAASEFLSVVGGLPFLPNDTLALEMADKIDSLFAAHTGFNKFYNEPTHARALDAYVSSAGIIPDAVRKSYVKTLIMGKIGNGHGISDMAVIYYDQLIDKFGESELREVAVLLVDREFASRVALRVCGLNFQTLVGRLALRTTNQVTQQAFAQIQSATNSLLPNLGKDSAYKRLLSIR